MIRRGVYRCCVLTYLAQAPGTAYHNPSAGWYRVTFSIAQDDLAVGLNKMEELLDLRVVV
jgi:hypothetical protein